jgi:hypothetical protein
VIQPGSDQIGSGIICLNWELAMHPCLSACFITGWCLPLVRGAERPPLYILEAVVVSRVRETILTWGNHMKNMESDLLY